MFCREESTVIVPQNDLESFTIATISRKLGIDTRVSNQPWGGRLGEEPPERLMDLKHVVVVVELPDPGAERRLRDAGHEVIVVDHHYYRGISRWKPDSSLEQFCSLVGSQMTEDMWAIAVNDRDFIRGIARLGMSHDEMESIRLRERALLGTSDIFPEALEYARSHQRPFSGLQILLAPERFLKAMPEAAQWPERREYEDALKKRKPLELPNCLIICHRDSDDKDVVSVECYTDASHRESFVELLADPALVDFEMWVGGGSSGCMFGAKPKHRGANIDGLIDTVLSFTLIGGRPLRHFATTFLFPFVFCGDADPAIDEALRVTGDYGSPEVDYVLPQVREFLYDTRGRSEDVVTRYRLPLDSRGEKLVIEMESEQPIPIDQPLTEIGLYRFPNGLHVLAVTVTVTTEVSFWDGRALWRILVDTPSSVLDNCTLEKALTFNQQARTLYMTYERALKEGKVPGKVKWLRGDGVVADHVFTLRQKLNDERPVSKVITAMIRGFVGRAADRIDLDAVCDERMFVHTCIAPAGPKPSTRMGERRWHAVFALAMYVDKLSDGWSALDGYVYDPDFVTSLAEPLTYRRWYAVSGSLYGFTHYSAAYVGFEDFFHEEVSRHVGTLYLRMSLMALFYRASLVRFGCRLAQIRQPRLPASTDHEARAYHEAVRDVNWDLTRFVNRYWFRELTSQDQGIELFDLQTRAMRLEQEYDALKRDIDRAYQHESARFQSNLSKASTKAGIIGLVLSIAFLAYGFITSNSPDASFLGTLRDSPAFFGITACFMLVLIFTSVVLAVGPSRLAQRWQRIRPSKKGSKEGSQP